MGKILRCAILLLIVDSFMVNFSVCTEETNTVEKSFEANQIVPDVVLKAPTGLLKVVYPGDVEVKLGNELTPTQVKDAPTVTWEASPANLYTIVMTDPDATSRQDPKSREFCHWMVGNVPGDNVAYGETLFYYVGSGPPEKTGLHRYVFLVYKQVGPITFDEPRVINTSRTNRPKFSIAKFAKKYNLGEPIAGNFFQAQYDDYVPTVHQQLNG